MVDALRAIGIHVEPPRATPYLWIRVPDGHDSASFTELVLEQAAVDRLARPVVRAVRARATCASR